MSKYLRGYIKLCTSVRKGKPTIYHRVGKKYKIKIGFNPCTKDFTKHPFPYPLCNFVRKKSMRLDTLKWNDHTFKQLTIEAKLIYCFLEAHCSTAGFPQADESDIANGIGLERRSGIKPFGSVVVLAMKELEDSGFIAQG